MGLLGQLWEETLGPSLVTLGPWVGPIFRGNLVGGPGLEPVLAGLGLGLPGGLALAGSGRWGFVPLGAWALIGIRSGGWRSTQFHPWAFWGPSRWGLWLAWAFAWTLGNGGPPHLWLGFPAQSAPGFFPLQVAHTLGWCGPLG